jgi:large subunit ribosomal protein L37Ae
MKKKNLGSAKRFGTRYGAPLKAKFAEIEKVQRSLQKCPHCNKMALKRESRGIFKCRSCGAIVAGKAYAIK